MTQPATKPATKPAATPSALGNGPRASFRDRLVAAIVVTAGRLACHLPERPLWAFASIAGAVNYRVSPRRRELARRNLQRVAQWMAANGVGEERFRRAATDRKSLDGLVRSAFREHALYYVEMARTPLYDRRLIEERLEVETPELVEETLVPGRPMIILGLHFGAIELPGLLVATRIGKATAPMETIRNPIIQRYIERTRGAIGVRIVDLDHAATELAAALKRGEPVGLITDRDVTQSGTPLDFFGAPGRLPRGPALLAVETGVPVYVGAVRRYRPGRYRGRMVTLPVPREGTRRERMRRFLEAEARVFEQLIALAPDQWWAVFQPIWDDTAGRAPEGRA